jgi:hypothetical protein
MIGKSLAAHGLGLVGCSRFIPAIFFEKKSEPVASSICQEGRGEYFHLTGALGIIASAGRIRTQTPAAISRHRREVRPNQQPTV